MRREKTNHGKVIERGLRKAIRRSTSRVGWLLTITVVAACTLGLVARAYSRRSQGTAPGIVTSQARSESSLALNAIQARNRLEARLTLQPEADRMRRRLGQRFQAPGREVSLMTGLLTIGSDRKPIRITRIQDEGGERVDVAIGTAETSFSWRSDTGVSSKGKAAGDADRALIERLVLDSPDQFVQAQLRTASYFTVARDVVPGEARGSDDYSGPVWNVVRVSEPEESDGKGPLSSFRLYYINASTGLIDKVAYEEAGQTVLAELSGWSNQSGEMVATHIVWTRNTKVVMEFAAGTVSHGPKQ